MTTRTSHLQSVLDHYQATRRLPSIAAAVLADGELAWTGTSGAETDPDVQYRIGSITKTMTAVLVLQCRDDGLLDLDDPIGRFIPETGYADATVRHLLAHVSGLQSEPVGPWWERSVGRSSDDVIAANDGSGRVFAAGQRYHYSNFGYALLGEAVSRLRGERWESLVSARVLEPLRLTRTSYLPQAPAATGRSVHHLRGTLTDEPATDTGALAPAGQIWSTVADLARFAAFLRTGQPDVLPRATLREMASPQTPDGGYGLGVKLLDHDGADGADGAGGAVLVGHLGSMPGFQASLFIDLESGTGAVVLTDATTGFSGSEITLRLLGDRTPDAVEPWVPTAQVAAWAEELLGYWHWGNSAFEVRWHNEVLELRDLARGAVVSERFVLREGSVIGIEGYHRGETLKVVRREDGTINHLDCATFIYTRVPYDPMAPIPGGHPH